MDNSRWYSIPLDSAFEKTRSGESGLSQRDARRRRVRGGGLIRRHREGLYSAVSRAVSDFSPVLLIIISLLALIMEQGEGAWLLIVLTLIYLAVTLLLTLRSQNVIESICGRREPRVQVLRDGRVFFIPSNSVVVGDVLLLSEGDVVPADCRVIYSQDLFAHEGGVTQNGFSVPKFAMPDDMEKINSPEKMSNMLFALSKITHGSGRALVVAAGDDCYVVKTRGRSELPVSGEMKILRSLDRVARTAGLAVPAVSFVLMLLDIILPSRPCGIYTTFLWGFSLCTASVGALYPLLGRETVARAVGRSASRSERGSGAVISDLSALEKISSADTVVFPLESTVLTSKMRVHSLYYDNIERETERPDPSGRALLARAGAVFSALEALPTFSAPILINPAVRAVKDRAIAEGADSREFPVLEAVSAGRESRFTTALFYKNNEYTACSIGPARDLMNACTGIVMHGAPAALTDAIRSHAEHIIETSESAARTVYAVAERKTGYNTLRLLSAMQTELNLVGFIVVEEQISEGFEEAMDGLRERNITPIVMSCEGKDVYECRNLVLSLGLASSPKNIITGEEIRTTSDKQLPERLRNITAALSLNGDDRVRLVSALMRSGKRPIYVGSATSDVAAVTAAPISIACASTPKKKRAEILRRDTDAYGSQILKLISHISIGRANEYGGGLLSVLECFKVASEIRSNLIRGVRFLVASHWLRIVVAALSVCLRVTAVTPVQIIMTGALFDLFAVVSLANRRRYDDDNTVTMPDSYIKAFKSSFPEMLAAGCLSVLIPYIVSFTGGFDLSSLPASVFSSLLLCQLATFAGYSCRRSIFLPSEWNGGITTGMLYFSAVLFLTLCVTIEPFGAFFSFAPASPHDMLLSFIAPAGLFIYFELKKIFRREKPKNDE